MASPTCPGSAHSKPDLKVSSLLPLLPNPCHHLTAGWPPAWCVARLAAPALLLAVLPLQSRTTARAAGSDHTGHWPQALQLKAAPGPCAEPPACRARPPLLHPLFEFFLRTPWAFAKLWLFLQFFIFAFESLGCLRFLSRQPHRTA